MLTRLWRLLKAFLTIDWIAFCHDLGRFMQYTAGRFLNDRCLQAASALTYTSLLSLVPLTTIVVGIISAFPAFSDLQLGFRDIIVNNLVPTVGAAVLDYLQGFAANAGRLTGFGLVGLIVTAVLLLATIEDAFNSIWRVHESRPLLTRLLSFWAILTLTPILTVSSLSVTTAFFHDVGLDERQTAPLMNMLPPLFEFVGLMALYWLIPNRSIRAADTAVGAIVATALFEVAKAGFALYLRAAVYETIYGALATVPIFLLWLYLTWSIVLIGAVIAAGLPDWRAGKLLGGEIDNLLPAQRLIIACAVLRVLLDASRIGTRIRRKTLLHRVPIGGAMLDGILDQLRHARFVERGQEDGWVLSRDLGTATLYDLARSMGIGLRGAGGTVAVLEAEPWRDRLCGLLNDADAAHQQILGLTLMQLLDTAPAPGVASLRRDPRRG